MLIRGGKHSSYLTTSLAFIFCSLNSYSITKEILVYHTYPKQYLLSLNFMSGIVIFFTGFILNLQTDSILRNLRKNNDQLDYKIPRGNSAKKNLSIYLSITNFICLQVACLNMFLVRIF